MTLVATGAKLVAYAPGRMTAAAIEGRDTSKQGSQCFVFLVCPKRGVILSETPQAWSRRAHSLTVHYPQRKRFDGENDSSEVHTEEFTGACPEFAEGC